VSCLIIQKLKKSIIHGGEIMRVLHTALIASLCSFTLYQPAFAADKEKILSASQSVVMIRGYNANGGLAYGSGVVIAKDKVITNCHIFRTTKEPWVARGEDTYPVTSVQADRYHDLCLITASLPFKAVEIGDINKIQRGQEVLSIGHSNGVPAPLTSMGTVKANYAFDGGYIIRSTAQFRMGASGSGLFDGDGNLLGINTFKTPGKPAYFYSLPTTWFANVAKQPVETVFPIDGKTFWEEDDQKKPFFMQMALPEINQDWPKLLNVTEKWVESEANNTEAWYEFGLAQERLNKLTEAKSAYEKSAQLEPNHLDALFGIGRIAKQLGDKTTAKEIHAKVAKIDENLAAEYDAMLECNSNC
jgi:hypothetical protein